ncbi:hypothetical protein, partial [Vitreimonas sp.]|uniref:hypothetical protein n=1 Tax=Vitreimonas sp. TaxID=3069702 RepID=UPI002ED78E51
MNAGAERDDGARAVTPHDPIEFLLAEHLNHRRMCRALERLAKTRLPILMKGISLRLTLPRTEGIGRLRKSAANLMS